MGADQLKTGRQFAPKLLIVVTDGYHNTLYKNPGPGPECGNDRTACEQDLIDAKNYAFNSLGGKDKVAIYAVGVGSDRDVSPEELLLIADGHAERVLRRNNFADLAANNLELIARACDENIAPCGGCCGFCVCGSCLSPDKCDSPDPCNPSKIPSGQICCSPNPVTCNSQEQADPCHTYKCDSNPTSPSAGKCIVNSTKDCGTPTDATCFKRQCDTATGTCQSISLCAQTTECSAANLGNCDDNNMCTTEQCSPDGKCLWQNVNCTAAGFVADACTTVSCSPASGCASVSNLVENPSFCDDNNNCTIDLCDPRLGCSYTNVTCTDGNLCTLDTCDPMRGCIYVPVVCPDVSSDGTCGVSFCEEGTCKRRVVACTAEGLTQVYIGAGIGTAAVVGIVIAAVLCAGGLAGGGIYAAASGVGGAGMAGLQNNPIYQASGTQGTNPLYKVVS